MHNKPLSGDQITVGIRKLEYGEHPFSIMQAFSQAEEFSENGIKYSVDGVPVIVRVVDSSDPMFQALNTVMYQHEFFNVPNPFDEYWKNRSLYV